jgi:hypothetical protein
MWGLLNIGLLLFFIVTCLRGTKLIREKYGMFASVVFVFGLLSFAEQPNNGIDNKEPNSNQVKTWKFASADSLNRNATFLIAIQLEKTLVSTYQLGIRYGKDKQGQVNIPISADSWMTGFISGTHWKPSSIIVNRTDNNNNFEYFVEGIVEWKLLGATVYSQSKEYKGITLTKQAGR